MKNEKNELKYKFNSIYEKEIARLIAKNRFMNDLFDFVLNSYFYNYSSRFMIELNNNIKRERIRTKFNL